MFHSLRSPSFVPHMTSPTTHAHAHAHTFHSNLEHSTHTSPTHPNQKLLAFFFIMSQAQLYSQDRTSAAFIWRLSVLAHAIALIFLVTLAIEAYFESVDPLNETMKPLAVATRAPASRKFLVLQTVSTLTSNKCTVSDHDACIRDRGDSATDTLSCECANALLACASSSCREGSCSPAIAHQLMTQVKDDCTLTF